MEENNRPSGTEAPEINPEEQQQREEEIQHIDDSLHLKYLVINPNDLLWGMAVNSVGFQEIGPGMPYPPSNHPSRYLFSAEKGRILNEYQLLYITKGKVTSQAHPWGTRYP